jgi:rhomboid protease GluP
MDWSLVLISQGIEAVIERRDDGYALLIDPAAYDRAMEAIYRYRRENRGWRWNKKLAWADVHFHGAAAFWCAGLAFCHWSSRVPWPGLAEAGRMDSNAVLNGAWWRLVTATMLHADVAHLAMNLASGFLLIGLAMGRYGVAWTLLTTLLAGVTGNLAGLLLHTEPYRGLGASGMVMGALGMLAAQVLPVNRRSPLALKYATAAFLAALMVFTLIGVDPKSDLAAHAGGLVSGAVLGALLACAPSKLRESPPLKTSAAIVLTAVILISWALAIEYP